LGRFEPGRWGAEPLGGAMKKSDPTQRWNVKTVVAASVVIVALPVAAFGTKWISESHPPNQAEMRAYVLSRMTDDDIRRARSQAELEYQKAVADAKADAEGFWREKSATLAKCEHDIAFKTRHPTECTLPLTWMTIGQPLSSQQSVEVIFERNLMGICFAAPTIRYAKEFGCLPR
jgi:hypothetical protein